MSLIHLYETNRTVPQLHLVDAAQTPAQSSDEQLITYALGSLPRYASCADALAGHSADDPLHILYPEKIFKTAQTFAHKFIGDTFYAVKANPSPTALRLAWAGGVTRFDVASIREVELVRRTLPNAEMAFMHPVKSRMAIAKAYAMGIRIFSFDHTDELEKILDETQHATDLTLVLRLEVNEGDKPAFSLKGKFGAKEADASGLLQSVKKSGNQAGVSFHVGSQCMDPAVFTNALSSVKSVVTQAGIRLDFLDVGGGFPVSYPGMDVLPLNNYITEINKIIADTDVFNSARIICEPGRALVAASGSVLVRVEHRRGNQLYLNDGTYGSLFDAGSPRWRFPVKLMPQNETPNPQAIEEFEFFGPTCDSLDHMKGPFMIPGQVREGDWLEIGHIGAYGQTMQTQFNGFYSNHVAAIWP